MSAPARLSAYLHLTRRCNLHCDYCYENAGPRAAVNGLVTSEWVHVVRELVEAGAQRVVLTGGEPLLRHDLPDILQAATPRPPTCTLRLATNGRLVDEASADLLARTVDEVRVSIDGPREVQDAERGAGSFDAAVRAIRMLGRAGATVAAAVTVTERSRASLPELVAYLALRTPVSAIHMRPALHLGRAVCRADVACDIWELGEELRDTLATLPGRATPRAPVRSGCRIGSSVMVDADGEVYPCHALAAAGNRLGNVREQHLAEILASGAFETRARSRASLISPACLEIGVRP